MPIFSTAGSKLFIGAALAEKASDFVVADFASQSWVEVKNLESLGSLGDSSQAVNIALIGEAREKTLKGARNAGTMEVVCAMDYTDPGQIAVVAAERTPFSFAFRLDFNDKPAARSSVATVTIAAPGVVSWNAHGLQAGDAVSFATTGALPTGIVAATTYYVAAAGLTTNAFSLAATPGGAAITTSGTQSGVHTISTVPTNSQRFFIAKVMSAPENLDNANQIMKMNAMLNINSNVVRVNATPTA